LSVVSLRLDVHVPSRPQCGCHRPHGQSSAVILRVSRCVCIHVGVCAGGQRCLRSFYDSTCFFSACFSGESLPSVNATNLWSRSNAIISIHIPTELLMSGVIIGSSSLFRRCLVIGAHMQSRPVPSVLTLCALLTLWNSVCRMCQQFCCVPIPHVRLRCWELCCGYRHTEGSTSVLQSAHIRRLGP
jgi:hypothetical protein